MKLSKNIFGTVVAFGLIALAITVIGINNDAIFTDAEVKTYTMTFSNEKNKIMDYIGYGEVEQNFITDLGNEVSATMTNIDTLDNGWGILDAYDGTFKLTSPVANIQSFTINTIDSTTLLEFNFGHYMSDYNAIALEPVDGVFTHNFTESANFIDLANLNGSDVEIISMSIVYTCDFQVNNPLLYSEYSSASGAAGSTVDFSLHIKGYDYRFNDISDRITYRIVSGSGTIDGTILTYGPAGDATVVEFYLTDSDGRHAHYIVYRFNSI